jgi:hypothetical protein
MARDLCSRADGIHRTYNLYGCFPVCAGKPASIRSCTACIGANGPQVDDYWTRSQEFPQHCIARFMSYNRFKMLKRFFHVSPPYTTPLPRSQWTKKVQPLSDDLQRRFQQHMLPATPVAVDEMMVRFTGRSVHTTVIKGKPIPEGYKILALCEKGYTYAFMYTSRVDSFADLTVPEQPLPDGPKLCKTSRAVLQLCKALPYQTHRFVLYCDNYFSNIPLFSVLRRIGIAACGTARPNSSGYPRELKVDKRRANLQWGTLAGVIVDDVLAFVWQDKNLVRFLTTAYPGDSDDVEMALRRRPRTTAQNRTLVQEVWGGMASRWLALPKASVRYNFHMGGVDLTDQRRSYYSVQLRTVRNWMLLFFLLVECAIINAFIICSVVFKLLGIKPKANIFPCAATHRQFRIRLAWNLVLEGSREINPQWVEELSTKANPSARGRNCPGAIPKGNNTLSRYRGYVGKNYELSPLRKAPGRHQIGRMADKSKFWCVSCLVCMQWKDNPDVKRILEKVPRVLKKRKTAFGCLQCNIPLCKEFCAKLYHEEL